MPDTGRERRDDLRDVYLAWRRVMGRNHLGLPFVKADEDRTLAWHAAATKKAVLRGGEEAARDIEGFMREWSNEARREFLAEVKETTGREYVTICGGIEKVVVKLLKRKRRDFDEFDLRLLRDYVADFPKGDLVESAIAVLDGYGA